MLYKDIEILQKFLKINYNITNMDNEEKNKFKYFYEEIVKLNDKTPSIEKLEELQRIVIDLEIKYDDFNDLGYYFDPLYVKIKKTIHEEKVKEIRDENKRKRDKKEYSRF